MISESELHLYALKGIEVMQQRLEELRSRLNSAARPPKLHPSDPAHPHHKRWVKSISMARRRHWESLTPKERRAHLAKMQAGRKKAR